MKRYTVILLIVVLGLGTKSFAQDIIWRNISRENRNLKAVLVEEYKPGIIYIGSERGVFKSQDGGENWSNILSIRGQNRAVNFLLIDPQNRNCLYAATADGLFYSHNQGKSWKRIFQGKSYLENDCKVVAVLSNAIYLGTKAGLFVSRDKGGRWHKQAETLGNSNIIAIASNIKEPDYIYVLCVDGVFKTQNAGESWEKVFIAQPVEDEEGNGTEDEIEDQDEEQRFSHLRYIAIDPGNLNYLYLATSRGVYKSQDRGKTWEAVSSYGLLSRDIKFLLLSDKSNLYAVTKSGVFEYRSERWYEISFGLTVGDIRQIALDNQNNLYAACDEGLFKAEVTDFADNKQNNMVLYFADEPKINAVQQAAIKYAEVEPEKIMHWRKQAAKKALLPQVSFGLDRNVTDLWHWETGSTTKTDDDTMRRGRDSIEWDVTLSWDFSELIWNDDQTSIDVRSRLMVELRDDVLDEVTKLYFERIRTKAEIDSLSIEDRKKRLEKELKLQELTASLDALTGGYFSQQLKDKT